MGRKQGSEEQGRLLEEELVTWKINCSFSDCQVDRDFMDLNNVSKEALKSGL